MTQKKQFEVVLRRKNGRVVKSRKEASHYAAKRLLKYWEATHDDTYYVEIVECEKTQ